MNKQRDTIIFNNSAEILNVIKEVDISSVQTFDFQGLFNNIDIEDMINTLVNLHKDFGLEKDISINKYKTLINLVLKENYILFDNKICHQIKGLPQGGPASNSLANIYLHHYEKDLINNSCNVLFRYIDHLMLFNKEIDLKSQINFYTNYLKLIKTNDNELAAEFLDLDIKIIDSKIDIKRSY